MRPVLYSKGLVRVPHQVRKTDRPTVSKTLARTLTPTVSMGRFSTKTWEMYWGVMLASCRARRRFQDISLTPGAAVAAKMKSTEVCGALVGESTGGVD